jgi:hypothetical protein
MSFSRIIVEPMKLADFGYVSKRSIAWFDASQQFLIQAARRGELTLALRKRRLARL